MPDDGKYLSIEDGLLGIFERESSFKIPRFTSFWEFVRDVWSKSFEHKSWFDEWFVGYLCDEVDRAFSDNKGICLVLPRGHLKSSVWGHGLTVYESLTASRSSLGLYLSYNDTMSARHMADTKMAIRNNPDLSEWMKDRTAGAEAAYRYEIDGKVQEVVHGGLFAFKRGLHTSALMVADDVLRDPANPGNLSELGKAEDRFQAEVMNIPNRGSHYVVLGTPMAPNDMLTKLKDDERFVYHKLTALDPIPGRRVLAPAIRTEQELLAMKRAHPRAFASEQMLQPYFDTNAYIDGKLLEKVCDASLINHNPNIDLSEEFDFVCAGFDIGKKRHPSHLAVFGVRGDKLIQICSLFMDNWLYIDQVKLINAAATHFKINKGYYDNTRSEFEGFKEQQMLLPVWKPLPLTAKVNHAMASIMENYISTEVARMIVDERQHTSILSVDIELKAPETPNGHGDAFWSCAMAMQVYSDSYMRSGVKDLGGLQDLADSFSPPRNTDVAKVLQIKPAVEYIRQSAISACPQCGEKAGWIEENKLCLICSYKASAN